MSRIDLNYDTRWWIPVQLDDDPDTWVPQVVRTRWDEEGLPADERRLAAVTEAVTMVVDGVRDADPPAFLALLLHPRGDSGVAAVAVVRIDDLDERPPLDELAADLMLPEQMLQAPAEVGHVDTRGGTAVRVRQQYRSPRDAHLETVTESVAYLWVVDDDEQFPLLITFSTAFEDLVAAEVFRPMVDEVARTVAMVPDHE